MVRLQVGKHHFLMLLLVLEVVRQSSILNLELEFVLELVMVLVNLLIFHFEEVMLEQQLVDYLLICLHLDLQLSTLHPLLEDMELMVQVLELGHLVQKIFTEIIHLKTSFLNLAKVQLLQLVLPQTAKILTMAIIDSYSKLMAFKSIKVSDSFIQAITTIIPCFIIQYNLKTCLFKDSYMVKPFSTAIMVIIKDIS